jgi:hypothetical protein
MKIWEQCMTHQPCSMTADTEVKRTPLACGFRLPDVQKLMKMS